MGEENNPTILEEMRQGISYARAGDKARAAAVFDIVLAQRPNHAEALVWKAAVIGDPAESIRCLEEALRIDPDNKRARVGLEWAYRRQKEQQSGTTTAEPVEPVKTQVKVETPPAPEPAKQTWPNPPNNSAATPAPATFQPGMQSWPNPETKAGAAPYKKRRLAEQPDLPPVDLPPEAIPWTRPPQQNSRPNPAPARPPRAATQESAVFQAASRSAVSFSVAPQVLQALRGLGQTASPVRLVWPLALFGAALGLALLTFVLGDLTPALAVLALTAAGMGVVLLNRVQL